MSPVFDVEPQVQVGRRAFPKAQELLRGVGEPHLDHFAMVGWHDSAFHPETGAFALVHPEGPCADLVGEIAAIRSAEREVFVYVLALAQIQEDMSLTRRAFLEVAGLFAESFEGEVHRVVKAVQPGPFVVSLVVVAPWESR